MADLQHPDRLAPIFAELDTLAEAIAGLQAGCSGDGARRMRLADPAPNVRPLRGKVMVPGDAWQALEALRGLTWAVRKLAEEVGKGAADERP